MRAAANLRNLLALVFHTVGGGHVASLERLVEFVTGLAGRNRVDVITPAELARLQTEFE